MKNLLGLFITCLVMTGISSQELVQLDKTFENETFFYDLSYLNSNIKAIGNVRSRTGTFKNKDSCSDVRKPPSSLRRELGFSYLYQKYTEAYEIPVIGSNRISDSALERACYVLKFYLANNNDLKKAFYSQKIRIVLLENGEEINRIPEFKKFPDSLKSVRGLSASNSIPLIAVNDHNIECLNDEANTEDFLFHQISYSLVNINALGKTKMDHLKSLYTKAKKSVPWKETFALYDEKEYLASAVDVYYNASKPKHFTLNELKQHDSSLVKFIDELIPCNYEYLNKCNSNRETERVQELEQDCKSARLEQIITTTTITTTTTTSTTTTTTTTTTRTTTTTTVVTTTRSTANHATTTKGSTTTEKFKIPSYYQTTKKQVQTTTSTTTTSTTTTASEECADGHQFCENWAGRGQCTRNKQFMHMECKKSCGLCGTKNEELTTTKIATTTSFFNKSCTTELFLDICKDEFAHCPIFASRGDCKTNPHHMLDKCKRSCNLCGDLVDQRDRIKVTTKKAVIRRPVFPVKTEESRTKTSTVNDDIEEDDDHIHRFLDDDDDDIDETVEKEECEDKASHCPELSARGDCNTNKPTMEYYCPKSCSFCKD